MQNNTIKSFIAVGAAFAFVFGAMLATPAQAHAFSLGQIIDPGCFALCDSGGGHSTKTVTNYYNGNYKSPGGTVINGSVTTSAPVQSAPVSSAPVYNNNYNYNNVSAPAPVVQQPVYSYNYNTAPIYTYGSSYSYNNQVVTQPVYVQQPAPVVYQQPVYVQQPAPVIYQQPAQYSYTQYQPAPQPVYQPVPVSTNFNGLDVACYADPTNASIEQPVTWNAEVTGGVGPYSYSWAGSNDISGAAGTVIKYYSTSGTKSAIVTVTSVDGRSATRACSNTVVVRSNAAPVVHTAPAPVVKTPVTNGNQLSANSLFSLANIPWGWVSVLIILILFFTVIYLMFNKTKI